MKSVFTLLVSCSCLSGETYTQDQLLELLEGHQKRHVAEFKKNLPEGYTLKPALSQNWSDDEQRVIGVLIALTPIGPDGKPDGEERHFASYQLAKTVPYKKGVRDGVEKRYLTGRAAPRKGLQVTAEIPWKNGNIHGAKKLFHDNGKLQLEVKFNDGIREGQSIEYDLNGRTVKSTSYKAGKRHGLMTEFWSLTGKPRRMVSYENGRINGIVKEYYDNGSLKKEIEVKDDEFHGVEKQYDEDGGLTKKKYWWHDDPVSAGKFKSLSAK